MELCSANTHIIPVADDAVAQDTVKGAIALVTSSRQKLDGWLDGIACRAREAERLAQFADAHQTPGGGAVRNHVRGKGRAIE